jgi:hypothetical protein
MNNPPPYVSAGAGDKIYIAINANDDLEQFKTLGFVADQNDNKTLVLNASTHEEKAVIFTQLRNRGIPFSAGKEWCPAELFEYYRDQKLLSGTFRRIAWTGPGKWHITVE